MGFAVLNLRFWCWLLVGLGADLGFGVGLVCFLLGVCFWGGLALPAFCGFVRGWYNMEFLRFGFAGFAVGCSGSLR